MTNEAGRLRLFLAGLRRRRVIQAAATDHREMTPNRVENFCCVGGAGLVACSDWAENRLKFGDTKTKQIKDANARKAVTAYDNCLHQIKELGEKHNLNIESATSLNW